MQFERVCHSVIFRKYFFPRTLWSFPRVFSDPLVNHLCNRISSRQLRSLTNRLGNKRFLCTAVHSLKVNKKNKDKNHDSRIVTVSCYLPFYFGHIIYTNRYRVTKKTVNMLSKQWRDTITKELESAWHRLADNNWNFSCLRIKR